MGSGEAYTLASEYLGALHELDDPNASANYVLNINATDKTKYDLNYSIETAVRNSNAQDRCELTNVREDLSDIWLMERKGLQIMNPKAFLGCMMNQLYRQMVSSIIL